MVFDYSSVTELPGQRVTREQLSRIFHRYRFAADFCEGRDVLEAACGAGQGLGYLGGRAKRLIAGDCSDKLVYASKAYYKARFEILLLDAHALPFDNSSFDVVILYEALYYLERPEDFLAEARRVLRRGGTLLIATANRDWDDFNPSPFSTRYFSIPELNAMVRRAGFKAEFYGAFYAVPGGAGDRLVSFIRKAAVRFNLIPRTMKGKEIFKRMFYGAMSVLKEELEEGVCGYQPPEPLPSHVPNSEYKIIYCAARI